MRSRTIKTLAVAAAVIGGLTLVPGVGSAASQKAHVNSNVVGTYLYDSPYGTAHRGTLGPCTNFYYDAITNGRYHDQTDGGYVSTDKAGSGWCGD